MRLLARAALAVAAAALAVAAASPADAAERGTITGRVINAATRTPQPGVTVSLTGGPTGATPTSRRALTAADGRFTFSGLRTGEDRAYALDARFERGLFAGGAVRLPATGERRPVVDTTLRVWPTTTDPSVIVVAKDFTFVVPGDSGAGAIESVTVLNTSERAYIGRGAELARGGDAAPTLAFALPAGATLEGLRILQASLDVPEIVPNDDLGGFATTMAVPPGPSQIVLTYSIGGGGGRFDLTRRALYSILDYRVFAAEPLSLETDSLQARGEVQLEGKTYGRWAAPGEVDAGDTIAALARAEADREPVLVGGAVAVLLAVALACVVALRSRRRAGVARAPAPPEEARAELLVAIAELDLRRRAGEVDETRYRRERSALKERLGELQEPEPSR